MKKSIFILLFLFVGASVAQAQFNPIKKFDYKLLKSKVLYIPKWSEDSDYAKHLIKRAKFDKLASKNERGLEYNRIWTEAMAQSSYDATPYEIIEIDPKKLFKQKNDKAIILMYYRDKYNNWFAQLWVTGPKRQVIASTVINGLNLAKVEDVRLMMNMLNYSMNTAAELEEEGSAKTFKDLRNKYKENLVEFFERMPQMTFLVPGSTHKNPKKAKDRDDDLKAALKTWKLSTYEFTTEDKLEEKRLEGDQNSYYWRNFNYYTNSPLITYHINFILTTEKDEVVFYFMGDKRLKPSTLDEIQTKIKKRSEKFKRQLSQK